MWGACFIQFVEPKKIDEVSAYTCLSVVVAESDQAA